MVAHGLMVIAAQLEGYTFPLWGLSNLQQMVSFIVFRIWTTILKTGNMQDWTWNFLHVRREEGSKAVENRTLWRPPLHKVVIWGPLTAGNHSNKGFPSRWTSGSPRLAPKSACIAFKPQGLIGHTSLMILTVHHVHVHVKCTALHVPPEPFLCS